MANNQQQSSKEGQFSLGNLLVRITLTASGAALVYSVLVIWLLIPPMRQTLLDQKLESCKRIIEVITSYLSQVDNSFKDDPAALKRAQYEALERLRALRFGPSGKDYIWIQGPPDDRIIMHPYRTDFENVDPDEVLGPDGQTLKILLKSIQMASTTDTGAIINYQWHNKDILKSLDDKQSYIIRFKPWKWIIGTGIYLQDLEKEVNVWKVRLLAIGIGTAALAFLFALVLSLRTERARMAQVELQRELRIREEQYRILFESANDAIIIMDFTHFIKGNQKAADIFGLPLSEVEGRTPQELSPEFQEGGVSSDAMAREYMDRALRGENLFFEWIHRRADGATFPAEVSLTRLSGEEPVLLLAIVRDISSRKNAEMEIQAREELFRGLFEHSPFGICFNDLETGVYIKVNPAFLRITGYQEEDVIGRTTGELLDSIMDRVLQKIDKTEVESIIRENQELLGKILDKGLITLAEGRFIRKDGSVQYALFTSVVLTYAGRKIILSLTVDITEKKILAEQLRHTGKMDILGQLAGGVAHDFNNMLGAILGNAELVRMDMAGNTEGLACMDTILNAARRAAELTGKLLAFSRKGKVISTPIDLKESILAAIALLERSIDKKITIEKKLEATNFTITGDPTLLQNALLNLAVNARDAMPEGGVITFSAENIASDHPAISRLELPFVADSYVMVSVSDTGTGIPESCLERIFEPFFTTKPEGAGTGLGLAAVYGTVKEHQGDLTVESQLGKGTIFHLFFPNTSAARTAQVKDDQDAPVKGSGSVLVVDDEDIIRSTTRSMLEVLGYTVTLAEDGEKAIEVLQEKGDQFTVILLDLVMPRLGGNEALDQVRQLAPQARIVITSGFNREGSMAELKERGANAFLQKPYRLTTLSRLLTADQDDLENQQV